MIDLSRTQPSHRLTASALAVATTLVLAACSGPASTPSTTSEPTTAQATTPAASAATTTPALTPTSAAPSAKTPVACGATPIVATHYRVDSLGRSGPVLSLGINKAGQVDAPPAGRNFDIGWWKGSPKPGSGKGHVVLTVHLSVRRAALGNEMRDKLKPGDLIVLTDAKGANVCYRYSGKTKIWVKDYKNSDTVWINENGPARLALLTCDNYNARTGEFDSRWVVYADQLPAGTY